MFDLVTFLYFSLSPYSLDLWRGKHMAGLIAWSAGNLNDKQLWMTSVGRRRGSEALGHLPMGMWSRRHQGGICSRRPGRIYGLEGLPQGNMAIQGFISCGIS